MHRISLGTGAAMALFAVLAHAGDHTIIARPNRTFDPPTLTINAGDTVTFMNDPDSPGMHNAVSDSDSVTAFRCANGCDGDGGNGDPDNNTWVATVMFPTAGTAPFHCEVHGFDGGGMHGTITIMPTTGGNPAINIDPGTLTGTTDEGTSTSVPLAIGNTGDADLTWNADTASTTCATPDVVPWLSIDPDNGTVAVGDPDESVTVTMDATALTPGVYNANVCVHSNDAANDPVTVPVSLTVDVSAADEIFGSDFEP